MSRQTHALRLAAALWSAVPIALAPTASQAAPSAACGALALARAAPANVGGGGAARAQATAEPSLLAEIEALDRTLAASERQLSIAEDNRRRSEASVADARAAEASARLRHAQASRSFARRLGALMRAGDKAHFSLWGGSRDVGTYVDARRLLGAIAAHDAALWRRVRDSHAELSSAARYADETRAALQAAEASRRRARDRWAVRRRQRSDKLRSLRGDGAAHLVLRREQAQATRALQLATRAAPQASDGPFAERRGRLPRPAEGRVRRSFGQRVELTYGTATAHNGVDIAAPAGAPVHAVAHGNVVWADWLRGYGQVVIVEHGGGYHTVMAHLAEASVRPGQKVAQGQRVGSVGDTGSLRGTVLYFEVRRRGVPQDPMGWFAG